MKTTLEQLANWLGHSVIPSSANTLTVCGIAIDSRTVVAGNVFIALCGERFDSHNFLASVEIQGAVAVIVERIPLNLQIPVFVVPNTRIALRQIASHWRKKFSIPLIAITGSNGKTTVKEMIAAILSATFSEGCYLVTSGNLNNDIGVPLTLCKLQSQHRVAVLELGMNHPGEIAILADITRPTLALVNNAQREHQKFMLNVEAVARENGVIFSVLPPDGIAVFPIEDQYAWVWRHQLSTRSRVLNFGLNVEANISATYLRTRFGNRIVVTTRINNELQQFKVNLAAFGQHNVYNALAAIACALAANISVLNIIRGLEAFVPINGRLQHKIASNGALIIDDTYNANPDSVRAAIDVLSEADVPADVPRILVLGDINEIGHNEKKYYKEIGQYAYQCGIEYFFGFGSGIRYAVQAFYAESITCHYTVKVIAQHFNTIEAINLAVKQAASAHTLVLVKGSRFMKMERVVQYLVGAESFTG